MNKTAPSILCAIAIVVLAALLLNPFHLGMPGMMYLMLLVALLAAFGAYTAFILREGGGDEREMAHRMFSGRVAFLSGALVFVIGIVYQGFTTVVDPWLVVGIAVMLVAKVVAHGYSDWRR